MNRGILLAATLSLLSAPILAQAQTANSSQPGGADRTLGNGSVESLAPRVGNPMSTSGTMSGSGATSNSSQPGGADRTLGNGSVESLAPRIGDPVSTSSTAPSSPREGGVDRTLGNGNVESRSTRQ